MAKPLAPTLMDGGVYFAVTLEVRKVRVHFSVKSHAADNPKSKYDWSIVGPDTWGSRDLSHRTWPSKVHRSVRG